MNFYKIVQKVTVCHVHFNNGIAIKSMWLSRKQRKLICYEIKMVTKDHQASSYGNIFMSATKPENLIGI